MSITKITMLDAKGNPIDDNTEYPNNTEISFRFEFDNTLPTHKVIHQMYYRATGTQDPYKISAVKGLTLLPRYHDLVFAKGIAGNIAGAELAFSFGLVTQDPVDPPFLDKDWNIYHTVKRLHLISNEEGAPKIKSILWSTKILILFGVENPTESSIVPDDHAFLHIHTRGMYGKKVKIDILLDDKEKGEVLLKKYDKLRIADNVLHQPVRMSEILANAKSISPDEPNFNIFVRVTPEDTHITPKDNKPNS